MNTGAPAPATQMTCEDCQAPYSVGADDLAFYAEISPTFNGQKYVIPPPTMCPICRHKRRLTWRNERVLYKRPCGKTGKTIISVFSEDKGQAVYDNDEWYESGWDAQDFGRDIDFNRPFFEQFAELMESVPLLARSTLNLQNSDYTNECGWSKNCYLIFEADGNENCQYANNMFDCRWSTDCLYVQDCELCYECIDCVQCYNCKYSQECNNCWDLLFCKNCIGCKQCIGCVNLRNKEHHIFNEPYSAADYEKKRAELMNGSWAQMNSFRTQAEEFALRFPHKCYHGMQNDASFGDHIRNTQRCYYCFDLYNAQDCKYVFNARNTKMVQDLMVFGADKGLEFCYENHEIGDSCKNIVFCDQLWTGCYDLFYCKLCIQNSHHCFGCVGLKHQNYCILNKQYSEAEYDQMAAKLVEHMQRTGEWGKPFPSKFSPYCYNESLAQQFFPITAEEAAQKGLKWKDKIIEIQDIDKIIDPAQLPDRTADIPDDVLNWAIRCPNTGRPFRIIKQEYEFLREHNLPIPRHHPDERHRLRLAKRNPQNIWQRTCGKCEAQVTTSYAPERPEIIYCEPCYQAAVE